MLLFGLIGCGNPFASKDAKDGAEASKKAADKKKKEEERIPVEVAPLERGPIESTITASTHIEAEAEVDVISRTANLAIELLVEEGDRVEKGQLLLRLEDGIQRTAVGRARIQVEKGTQEFERQKALHAQSLISDQAFTDTEFELKRLKLSLEDAERELEYTEIRAPIAGTVTARHVSLGDQVTTGQTLFHIIDFESIVARIYIPEKHLSKLKTGLSARILPTVSTLDPTPGYVERVAPIVDSQTGTVKVTVAMRDPGSLRPGMYVEVKLVLATRTDVLLLSKRSLVYDDDQIFVFRYVPEDRKVERVSVIPGLMNETHVEASAAFHEGDLIVVAGQTGLKDGAAVRLPGEPAEDKAGNDAEK